MPDEQGRFTPEEAAEEAAKMRELVENGEAKDYPSAEQTIEEDRTAEREKHEQFDVSLTDRQRDVLANRPNGDFHPAMTHSQLAEKWGVPVQEIITDEKWIEQQYKERLDQLRKWRDSLPRAEFEARQKTAAEKMSNDGGLAVTAEDHLFVGSTPPRELMLNPGKAFIDMMDDVALRAWCEKEVEAMQRSHEETSKMKGMRRATFEDINKRTQESLKRNFGYLRRIGRLPKEFEDVTF